MKVHVTIELDLDDDIHPDYAARIIDNALWNASHGGGGPDGIKSWSTINIKQKEEIS